MKNEKNIEWAGMLLGFVVLVSVIQNLHSPEVTLDGLSYILGAACLGLVSLMQLSKSLLRRRNSNIPPLRGPTLTSVHMIAAWQLVIIGLLNIWAVYPYRNNVTFILSYASTLIFVCGSGIVIQLIDNPNQAEGAKPLLFFGRPRSRILFMYGLCYLLAPIFLVGLRVFFLPRECPPPFQPARLSLLLVSIFTVFTSGLAVQRYRFRSLKSAFEAPCTALIIIIATYIVAIHFVAQHNKYVWILSIINIIGILAYVRAISYGIHETAEAVVVPRQNAIGTQNEFDSRR